MKDTVHAQGWMYLLLFVFYYRSQRVVLLSLSWCILHVRLSINSYVINAFTCSLSGHGLMKRDRASASMTNIYLNLVERDCGGLRGSYAHAYEGTSI